MVLSLHRKITIVLLVLYWPTLFFFAHMPIPRVVQQANVSDKSLHFLAYLVLVYLLWFSILGERKVSWRGVAPWCMLVALAIYGILDEWSQSFVAGRSCDPRDLCADMSGVFTGLVLISVFTYWLSGLFVVAILIFGVTNVTSANLGELMPVTSGAFHFFAYAAFAVLWMQHVCRSRLGLRVPRTGGGYLVLAIVAPAALLLSVKLFAVVSGRVFGARDMLISAGGIGVAVGTMYVTSLLARADRPSVRAEAKR